MPTAKERLIELHKDFHGATRGINDTELVLIVDILESLIEVAEEQRGHTHTLS